MSFTYYLEICAGSQFASRTGSRFVCNFFRELTSSSFAASSSTSLPLKNLFFKVSPFHRFYFLEVFLTRRKSVWAPHRKSIFAYFFSSNHMSKLTSSSLAASSSTSVPLKNLFSQARGVIMVFVMKGWIFILKVCFTLKTMNYGSVRIGKQGNNNSNSCLHLLDRC